MKTGEAGIPRTLPDAIRYFSDPDNCLNFAVMLRWPDGVHGPSAADSDPYRLVQQA